MSEEIVTYCRTKQWINSLQSQVNSTVQSNGQQTTASSHTESLDAISGTYQSVNGQENTQSLWAIPNLKISSPDGVVAVEKNVVKTTDLNNELQAVLPFKDALLPTGQHMLHKVKLAKSSGDLSCYASITDCDDLRSPIVLSPAPSSVFFDEDTQDSGYDGSQTMNGCASQIARGGFRSISSISSEHGVGFNAADEFLVDITNRSPSRPDGLYADLFSGDLRDAAVTPTKNEENDYTPKKRQLFEINEESDSPFMLNNLKIGRDNNEWKIKSASGVVKMKRHRSVLTQESPGKNVGIPRCFSEADVMNALHQGADRRDLIGDYSTVHALPILSAPRIPDLIGISGHVLAQLLDGHYKEVKKITIIDCRYPYEYEGGHVKGAINIYTREKLDEIMFSQEVLTNAFSPTSREVLVFYCEFSQERGPTMSRYLRAKDRRLNASQYPRLRYPEIYLLDGGYKNFFPAHKEYCEPREYVPMLHQDYATELRKFRSKSRSWTSTTPSVKVKFSRRMELRF